MANGGGAPPPLPAGGGIGPAAAGAPAGGAVGGVVAPCKWEILVKVHSQERFWPKKNFDVKIHDLNADGSLGASAQSQNLSMVAKISPEARFCGEGTKTYGTTATVENIAEEADWMLAAGKTSKDPLPKKYSKVTVQNGNLGKNAKKVDLYIRHPLLINLQLKFKDPEDRILNFPKDFPVQVYNAKK